MFESVFTVLNEKDNTELDSYVNNYVHGLLNKSGTWAECSLMQHNGGWYRPAHGSRMTYGITAVASQDQSNTILCHFAIK